MPYFVFAARVNYSIVILRGYILCYSIWWTFSCCLNLDKICDSISLLIQGKVRKVWFCYKKAWTNLFCGFTKREKPFQVKTLTPKMRLSFPCSSSKGFPSSNDWTTKANAKQSVENSVNFMLVSFLPHEFTVDCEIVQAFLLVEIVSWVHKNTTHSKQTIWWRRKTEWNNKSVKTVSRLTRIGSVTPQTFWTDYRDESK